MTPKKAQPFFQIFNRFHLVICLVLLTAGIGFPMVHSNLTLPHTLLIAATPFMVGALLGRYGAHTWFSVILLFLSSQALSSVRRFSGVEAEVGGFLALLGICLACLLAGYGIGGKLLSLLLPLKTKSAPVPGNDAWGYSS
jgi:hypothetical protein